MENEVFLLHFLSSALRAYLHHFHIGLLPVKVKEKKQGSYKNGVLLLFFVIFCVFSMFCLEMFSCFDALDSGYYRKHFI